MPRLALICLMMIGLSGCVTSQPSTATVINEASGGMSAPALINAGLAGIGLRGAMQ